MKTIGFYSYKGGTGKSLMAANLAVCLSRLGKNCVVVDCDVEGPSVHNKFGRAGKGATGKGGLIGFIASHFGEDDWDKEQSLVNEIEPSPMNDIERYLYELPNPWEPTLERTKQGAGTIRLLPAGDVQKPEYWKIVWSPLWHEMFTLYHRYSLKQIDEQRYKKLLTFFLEVKSALASLTPEPDYMIVDFRAGASELSSTLINAWVDTLVYAFGFNEDSIDYLANTLAKVWHAGHDKHVHGAIDAPFDIELVLSRVPTGINYRGDRMLWDALRGLRIGWDEIHVLHSDRDLEMSEEIRSGFRSAPQNRRLTQDYLKLFEKLFKPEDIPDAGLSSAIGLPEDLQEVDRIFTWESERGALINPNDGSRNVSFKVATFQGLLLGLEEGLAKLLHNQQIEGCTDDGAIERRTRSWLHDALHSAGQRCGAAFGDALSAGWRQKRDLGIEARIRMWCEFDSDVGFGRFSLNEKTIEIKGPRLTLCDIQLRESFLTPAKDTNFQDAEDHRLCSLMTGYVQGVLSRILGYEVDVDHSIDHGCLSEGWRSGAEFRSESCQFHVTIKKASMPQESGDLRHSESRKQASAGIEDDSNNL